MAIKLFPFMGPLGFLRKHLLRLKFPSLERAGNITRPMLIITGVMDELIPPTMSAKLYRALQTPDADKSLMTVETGTHNDCWRVGGQRYMKTFARFIVQHSGLERKHADSAPSPKAVKNDDDSTQAQTEEKIESHETKADEQRGTADDDARKGVSAASAEIQPDGEVTHSTAADAPISPPSSSPSTPEDGAAVDGDQEAKQDDRDKVRGDVGEVTESKADDDDSAPALDDADE